MCFVKMLCHDVDSPNALKGALRHKFCRFKWVGSMIIVWDPFLFIKKKKSRAGVFDNLYIITWVPRFIYGKTEFKIWDGYLGLRKFKLGRCYIREFQLSSVFHVEPTKKNECFKTSKFGPIATLPAILEFILPINSIFLGLWVIREWPWKETRVAASSNYRNQDMKYRSKLDRGLAQERVGCNYNHA